MESSEIETLVGELETRVDRLRALYEQYFMGIEKMVPSVPHKDVERRIQVMRKEQIRNTAVRFRFQMIIQRYNTYQTHWQRICRQIEEGTYKRDMLRAQRRFKSPEAKVDAEPEPPPPAPEPSVPRAIISTPAFQAVQLDPLDDFADLDRILNAGVSEPAPKAAAPAPPRPMWRKVEAKPAAPPPAPPAAPAPPKPPPLPAKQPPPLPKKPTAPPPLPRSPADLSDDRMRQLYTQYVQTRRERNESTAAITYDAMAKSLRESSAKLREKHGKSVDFEVTVKDGKTILRPVVKR
ncbi:MAG TPA: MXAN_5187 C-terminal domain-containing protein [Polyangiaceae bacterium]